MCAKVSREAGFAALQAAMLRSPLAPVLLLTLATHAFGGDFEVQRRERDGLVLETRLLADSRFPEIRVRTHAQAPAAALAEAMWTFRRNGVEGKLVERRQVLQETANSRLVWQLLQPPVVSRRESLIRYSREHESSGAIIVRFQSETGQAPQHAENAVKVGLVRGSWKFVPDGSGGTYIEHTCLSEPGGDIPPWLALSSQEDMAIALLREVVSLGSLAR